MPWHRAWLQGLLSALLNPKLGVFFLTLLPQFIAPGDSTGRRALQLAVVFDLIGLAWLLSYSAMLGAVGGVLTRPGAAPVHALAHRHDPGRSRCPRGGRAFVRVRTREATKRYDAPMRFKLVIPLLLVALVAACGGGSAASNANPSATNQVATGQPAGSPARGGNGTVDCAAIKTAAQQLLAVQFLAQLRTADTIEQIRDKKIGNLDLDAFLAGMRDLHALDSYSSPLGDPKAAIDAYEKAGAAAQVLFATDPITQAAIDTYNENVGTIPEFLSHQSAIAGAMDEANC